MTLMFLFTSTDDFRSPVDGAGHQRHLEEGGELLLVSDGGLRVHKSTLHTPVGNIGYDHMIYWEKSTSSGGGGGSVDVMWGKRSGGKRKKGKREAKEKKTLYIYII
jgi:hypothetical protein